jgi:hypothetical protein
MNDQNGGSILVDIAAARALQWNVDFDRGLRSPKPGVCVFCSVLGGRRKRLNPQRKLMEIFAFFFSICTCT